MIPGLYEFVSAFNGKAYTGSSANIKKRERKHRWMLRNGCHHSAHFQSAWDLYGEAAFKFIILEVIEDASARLAAEQTRIDERFAAGTSYNMARDVTAPFLGRKHTEESLRKMKGRVLSEETLCKMRGRVVSEETRDKIRAAMMGQQHALGCKRSKEYKRALSERMMGNQQGLGHKHTDEERRRQSERMMGRKFTEEHRRNISNAKKGKKHSPEHKHKNAMTSAKPYPAFIHRDTGEIVPAGINLKHMCQEHGLDKDCMRRVKNGKQSHHKGWVLLDETGIA